MIFHLLADRDQVVLNIQYIQYTFNIHSIYIQYTVPSVGSLDIFSIDVPSVQISAGSQLPTSALWPGQL